MRRAGLLVIFLLTACAGPRPDIPGQAAVSPPAAWRDTPAVVAQPVDWSSFGDPVMTALIDHALANNSDIAVAAARVDEARAQFAAARGALLPSVGASGGLAYGRSLNAFGTPTTQGTGQAALSVAYEVDIFGRLRNASSAARAALQASQAARDSVRLSVAASVASGYITLRALDARLAVLQETLATRDQALKLARRRADTGYSPVLELRQAEADDDSVAQLIPATQLAIRRQEDALSLLVGDNPRAIERGLALEALTPVTVPVGLPSQVLRQRPDIAQAEAQLVASDRSLDVARDAFLPVFNLTASGGRVGADLLPRNYDVFSLGASVAQPIFQGGRLHANADAAAARRDQAAFGYRKTALNAFREVEDALAAVSDTGAQQQALTGQVTALAETFRMASNRYTAGYSPYLEQLDAQRGLLTAQLALIQTRADNLNARVALFQAVGGGWMP